MEWLQKKCKLFLMFLKFSLLFIFCCVALASTDGQIFSPKDVENGLISEGVTEPGAHEITEFLFKVSSFGIDATFFFFIVNQF